MAIKRKKILIIEWRIYLKKCKLLLGDVFITKKGVLSEIKQLNKTLVNAGDAKLSAIPVKTTVKFEV